ncbi:MAG: hypothetical protein IPL42_15240 [Saprospiraceae bacterium]|nr:hypothetical protein [Saprospiraceae bacterium]
MWKVFSYHKAILFLCFNFIVLTTIIGQDGIKPFINRHPLQSTTARAKFQSFFISENGLIYIATSEGIILFNGQNEKLILGSEQVTNQQVKYSFRIGKGFYGLGVKMVQSILLKIQFYNLGNHRKDKLKLKSLH